MALLLQLTQKLAHGFQAFWDRYPRREAKKDATKAWGQVVKDDPEIEAQIHAALDWQVPMLLEREVQYRPLPATWLRGERWTDEKPTPKTVTLNPTIGRRHEDAIKQQNVTSQIQFLVSRGMSLEAAKRQVYREQGWI